MSAPIEHSPRALPRRLVLGAAVLAVAITIAPVLATAPVAAFAAAPAPLPATSRAETPDPPSAEGATWGVRFTPADGAPRDRLEYTLRPGESASDVSEVINQSDEVVVLDVDPADAAYGGAGVAGAIERDPVEAGLWITPGRTVQELPAHSEQELPFTITVPEGTEPGAYAAALTLSQVPDPAADGTIPVQRTLIMITHIEVIGDATAPTGFAFGPAFWWVAGGLIVAALLVAAVIIVTQARRRDASPE